MRDAIHLLELGKEDHQYSVEALGFAGVEILHHLVASASVTELPGCKRQLRLGLVRERRTPGPAAQGRRRGQG